ncbi:MAG: hypothetical protein HQL22_09615 [Candidatus Omnitrophica bacterium]|nr:hypothetical protein [Candidatus Omnitrophota bacterium]
MGQEYKRLQELLKSNILRLELKNSLKDLFGLWVYWQCKTKPSVINLFGKAFLLYWIISCDWVWVPLAIVLAIKISWWFLLIILTPYVITQILGFWGRGFILFDVANDENFFDDLYRNSFIGIFSAANRDSMLHKEGVPEKIILYPKDWRREIESL